MTGSIAAATAAGASARPLSATAGISPTRQHRLDVIALSVEEVVTGLGPWMFDQALAGWDVRALVRDCIDDRALRILGVAQASFDETLCAEYWSVSAKVVAVSVTALESDSNLPSWIADAVGGCEAEIFVWGSHRPSGLACQTWAQPAGYSRASRLFHQHALSALPHRRSPAEEVSFFGMLRSEASPAAPARRRDDLPDGPTASGPKYRPA